MKKLVILVVLFITSFVMEVYAEDRPKAEIKATSQYTLEIKITGIPKGQQTLFVPVKLDTMVVDFDKVGLEALSTQNILAVASTSKDKVGPGVGLLKFDENGLPESLTLKASLKPVGVGQTTVSLLKVAADPSLPSKGVIINNEVAVNVESSEEIEVIEKVENGKKKLSVNEHKLTLSVQRPLQKEETIFIPLIFDKGVVDIDETFGHAILEPGIAAKSFSSGSLHEGGPGVEIVLSPVAGKDFTVDVDIIPRGTGKTRFIPAFPQKGHTAIVPGPQVDISPTTVSVGSSVVLAN